MSEPRDQAPDESEPATDERVPMHDALSIAIVASLAALLLLCVVLIFVANGHRPAGL